MSNTNTNLQTQTSSVLHNDTVSSCSTSKVQEKTQLSKERCMKSLKAIQLQFKFLTDTLQDFGTMTIFKRTFAQDLDLLEQHLTKEIISQTDCKTTLTKLITTFENAFNSEFKVFDLVVIQNTCSEKEDSNSETASSKSVKESSLDSATKDVHMQTQVRKIDTGKVVDNGLVVMKSNGMELEVQDESSRTGNDTDVDDADIRPIYDEEPMAETTDYSKQSLKSENILLKKTVAQFQKDFSRMEAHCIALELKYQNQALKSGQHGQILNETSNKAKIKKEIDVLETMNIELEHSVAKLRKENETLKKHYKDLYDSIKITRSKTIEQTTSLLANNADLKAQIQEKVFAIAALKNDLRKLKGNSVDTKFAKTSVLGKPVLQSLRNQSVVRQPNAFKSERPQMSKQRFASQVDVNNNLSRPVTQHYFPKRRESVFAKPDHMIASSESRNSSKNMPRFSSNDMVHNHYLDEARKKTQERDRNSKTSVMPSIRFQSTIDGNKPKPRSNNQTPRILPLSRSSCVTITVVPKANHSKSPSSFSDSKQFVCYTCHKCVFNANHDASITKLLKEVNSRAKIQSHMTKNSNKPVVQKSHTQKPGRQIFTRHRFSPNKTFAVYEKTSPRADLRWKPTGRIFKSVGLRWISTGKLFNSCTSKDDSEPTLGSNVDISNIHESKQTLDLSARTSTNVQKEQSLNLSAVGKSIRSFVRRIFQWRNFKVVSKSSAVTTADASDKRQQQPDSTSSTSTLATTVSADGNFDL
ncbi:hypothetical protein Tco_0551049 [Tanacetum coccineum]